MQLVEWLHGWQQKIHKSHRLKKSAYYQARLRLPEKLLQRLFGQVAQGLEKQVTSEHLWCGRHVKVIDGSTVSMPDTPLNQETYPQLSSQASGCGFPIALIWSLVQYCYRDCRGSSY